MPVPIQDLTPEAFAPFGWMLGKPLSQGGISFSSPETDFWEEHLFDAGPAGNSQILWVTYRNQDHSISLMEAHRLTQQILTPLTGDVIQIVAGSLADGSLDQDSLSAFHIKVGQGICMRPGCWHTTRVNTPEVKCLMVTRQSTTADLVDHLKGASLLKESALAGIQAELA